MNKTYDFHTICLLLALLCWHPVVLFIFFSFILILNLISSSTLIKSFKCCNLDTPQVYVSEVSATCLIS